jgi:outer membrane protein
MKRSLTVVCLLASAVGASSVVFASSAAAQTPAAEPPSAPSPAGAAPSYPAGPAKVAVIIFQQAVASTNEGQRSFAELRDKFAPKQAQLKTQSDEVDSLKKQLQDAGANLSDQERDSRLKTIDDKTKALQRVAEDDQNDFNSQMNDMYQALAQKVYVTVDKYAKQNGFTVVLDASNQQSSPVLWINPGVDITKAVVDAYNASSGVAAPGGAAAPKPASSTHPATTPRSTTPATHPSTTTHTAPATTPAPQQ